MWCLVGNEGMHPYSISHIIPMMAPTAHSTMPRHRLEELGSMLWSCGEHLCLERKTL